MLRYALMHRGPIVRHGGVVDGSLQRNIDSVRAGTDQLSDIEYGILLGVLLAKAPANALVFGLGADSDLWSWANREGRTVFLEDKVEWVKAVVGAECHLVTYPGFELPRTLSGVVWDVIFVDGPMGWRPEHPGRREAIRAAATLGGPGSWIFVHDYNRRSERACCDEYLGQPAYTVDRTAVFRPT
jgi:IRX15/IRX15L/GXM